MTNTPMFELIHPRKCKECGIELERYLNDEPNGTGLRITGWRPINQENSFDYNLCSKCCWELFQGDFE